MRAFAERALAPLARDIEQLSASSLAWMLVALLLPGIPASHELFAAGAARLAALQRADGSWPSDDTPDRDVHTTVEALRVLATLQPH